jgi:hypothetical protein
MGGVPVEYIVSSLETAPGTVGSNVIHNKQAFVVENVLYAPLVLPFVLLHGTVGVAFEVFGSGSVSDNANSDALPEAEENLKALG